MSVRSQGFDLFLSYNYRDHQRVEAIARRVRRQGLTPFLDRWYLAPGRKWQLELEDILASCRAVVVCVGPNGMGTWQQREIDAALDRQSQDPRFPIIPLILPGSEPPLGFLRQLTWVDLRSRPLEQGLQVLAKAVRGEPPSAELRQQMAARQADICPYRGLLYFREEDAPLFFGRDGVIAQLVQAVKQKRFVAVVGASGSGKSSVVRAGLIPKLRCDRHTTWEIATLVPGDQPLRALAAALVPLLKPAMTESDRLREVDSLSQRFAAHKGSLGAVIRRILAQQPGTDRLLLVIDQWEELYTLTQDDAARCRFVDELLAATTQAPATVVLALRADFVGKALAYRPWSDRLQSALIHLGPMTRAELEQAVTKPGLHMGLSFEPGLIERILDDVGHEPGNLPLLEFVLRELWERRRDQVLSHQAYDDMGGLSGATAKLTERSSGTLSPPERVLRQKPGAAETSPARSCEVDLLTLAFRLVVARHAAPESLLRLEADKLREAVRRVTPDADGAEQFARAQEILARQPEVAALAPNPLWVAWMRTTQARTLRELEDQLLSGRSQRVS
jgi:hypothetical protein